MKREKWYMLKNPETGNVIYCPIRTMTAPHDGYDSYYVLKGRGRMSHKARKRLHVYRSEAGHVAKSMRAGIDLNVDLFDSIGDVYDEIPLEMVR